MTGLLGSVNAGSLLITIVYSALLAWGFSVGLRQIYQGYRAPQELLNPLFANRWAIRLFTLHIFVVSAELFVIGAMTVNWFHYYILVWWLIAYRYLDVGPRRLLQTLYNTPEKKASRPWAPILNWAVIATLYVLAFLAV